MEQIVKHPSYDPQEDLLKRYCREAESLLGNASSLRDALEIKEQMCARFESECESKIIVTATRAFMEEIINRNWRSVSDDKSPQNDKH